MPALPFATRERGHHRARGAARLLWIGLVGAGAVVGTLVWKRPVPVPPVVVPLQPDGLDEEVRELVDQQIARTRAAPADARGHGKLGLMYEANELWQESQQSFGNAALLAPDEPLWRYHQAIALRQAGLVEESLALLEEVSRELVELPAVHHRLGLALLEAGRLAEAATAFQTVKRLAPNQSEGHAGLADVRLAEGAAAEAAALLERALELDPTNKAAHYSLGIAYRTLGRTEEATRELNLGQGAQPRFLGDPLSREMAGYAVNYSGRMKNAVALMDAGQFESALRLFQKAREKRPDDKNVLNNLAAAYIELRQYAEARNVLLRVVELDDEEFAARINLAVCYLNTGDLNEALAQADTAVRLAPSVGRTHFTRATVLTARGDLAGAYDALTQTIRLDTRDPMVFVALGETCLRLRRYAEARDRFKTATVQAPDFLPAHVNLVNAHLRLGEIDEAREAFAVAEGMAPNHPQVESLRRKLQSQR